MINLLKITKNNSKNSKKMQIIIFEIEIDTKNFIAKLPNQKLEKAVKAISKVLAKQLIIFLNIQSLIKFLFFCFQAMCLKSVFIQKF